MMELFFFFSFFFFPSFPRGNAVEACELRSFLEIACRGSRSLPGQGRVEPSGEGEPRGGKKKKKKKKRKRKKKSATGSYVFDPS